MAPAYALVISFVIVLVLGMMLGGPKAQNTEPGPTTTHSTSPKPTVPNRFLDPHCPQVPC